MKFNPKLAAVCLMGICFALISALEPLQYAKADVHYDSWTSYTYKTLTPGQEYHSDYADGRASQPNKRYVGVEHELIIISPSGYTIWHDFYWCPGIPGEYWPIGSSNPTYPNGGILHIHLKNEFPYTTIYFKYRWRLYWEDV